MPLPYAVGHLVFRLPESSPDCTLSGVTDVVMSSGYPTDLEHHVTKITSERGSNIVMEAGGNMPDNNKMPERLVEAIAEGMWYLIRRQHDHDWKWCIVNDESTAAELRYRARCTLVAAEFKEYYEERKSRSSSLDLRFKDALVKGELK